MQLRKEPAMQADAALLARIDSLTSAMQLMAQARLRPGLCFFWGANQSSAAARNR